MASMLARPIAPDLFTEGEAPQLIGGRHRKSGRVVFPLPDADTYERWPLARRGTLWSYTIQRFPPKSPPYAGPIPFEPFAVGYVELDNEVIVEARLVDVEFADLRIGMPVELVIVPFRTEADGTVVLSYAFRPLAGASS